jgi:hypothetical protein
MRLSDADELTNAVGRVRIKRRTTSKKTCQLPACQLPLVPLSTYNQLYTPTRSRDTVSHYTTMAAAAAAATVAASLLPPLLLLLLLSEQPALVGAEKVHIVVPEWDYPMNHTEHCVKVADHPGVGPPPPPVPSPWGPPSVPPKPFTVVNDSRWAFVALPHGAPPPGGWPVLIDLAIIDFNGTTASGETCGLDGVFPPGEHAGFRRRLLSDRAGGEKGVCTPISTDKCKTSGDGYCLHCRDKTNCATCCPGTKLIHYDKQGHNISFCEAKGGGGGGHHGKFRGFTEGFPPFATPDELMAPCQCFAPNGKETGCPF